MLEDLDVEVTWSQVLNLSFKSVIWWKLFDFILFESVEIWYFDSLVFKCSFFLFWKGYWMLLKCVRWMVWSVHYGWKFEIKFVRLLKLMRFSLKRNEFSLDQNEFLLKQTDFRSSKNGTASKPTSSPFSFQWKDFC